MPRRVRAAVSAGSRTSAATPDRSGGRDSAGRVAAEVRPDPEKKTQEPPPPTPSRPSGMTAAWRDADVLTRCGITDLDVLVERCRHARRALDRPTGRWTRHTLMAAIQLALTRGWPPTHIETALLTVAADPDTRSPMRLAEAGPWWDTDPAESADPPRLDGDRPGRAGGRTRRRRRTPTRPTSPSPHRAHRRTLPPHPNHRRRPSRPDPPPNAPGDAA